MLLFVSIWNREDTKANNNGGEKRQNETLNEDEINLFEVQSASLFTIPHGNPLLEVSLQERKWHASQVWINGKLFPHAPRNCSQRQTNSGQIYLLLQIHSLVTLVQLICEVQTNNDSMEEGRI